MAEGPSSADPVWIGVDLGTQSVRAVALADDGSTLAIASRPLSSRRDGDRHEQDPVEWWSATCAVLREVTEAAGRPATAVAVSATSGTVLVTDDRGRPLTNGLMYDDARGAGYTDRANEAGESVWSRLGYRMQATWALPKILWLRHEGVLSSATVIAHQPDVITARLAGRRLASDSSHALKSGLDLDSIAWPDPVMDRLDIPRSMLPEVVAAGSILGSVDATGSAETGLPEGCLIVAGMTDGCAAQLAAGAVTDGEWNSVLGTTLVVKGMSATREVDPTGTVYAHRAPFGAGWYPGGASSTGAGAVSHWLPGRDLAALTERASAIGALPSSYPLVGKGERFPFVAREARAFFGDSDLPPADDAEALAAIAHGVAYTERLCYDLLASCGYDVSGTVSFTGGGARNPWWNQLRCDVLQRPARVPERGEGAFGMALLAAAATDDARPAEERLPAAASRLLGTASLLEPGPAPALAAGYRSFVDELVRRDWLPAELHAYATARVDG